MAAGRNLSGTQGKRCRVLRCAVRFYTNVLGLKLLSRDAVARFSLDGVLFELVPSVQELPAAGEGNGRLCLRVADLAQVRAELLVLGVATSEPQVKENGRLSSLRDPDGNEICLWQYLPG